MKFEKLAEAFQRRAEKEVIFVLILEAAAFTLVWFWL